MRRFLYPRLAFSGIIKNSKTYIPYIIACIGSVMALYIVGSLSLDPKLKEIPEGILTSQFLFIGIYIIGIFSFIFLFYTNSFLVKRRKKEYGLYNVLGMGKRHIAKMAAFETLFIGVISIGLGILLGAIFSKLMLLLLLKILGSEISFGMNFSPVSAGITAGVFGFIFLFNLVQNTIRIGLNKTVDLLYGGKKGEKEPRTNIPLAAIGFAALAGGYVLALKVEDPGQAVVMFFVAVILVVVGTYALITAGSTVVLKLLKRNKKYYYKYNHFVPVSGMLYRMKQNAAGIATICILSTMVLVTVSTTACLYFGSGNSIDEMYYYDVYLNEYNVNSTGDERKVLKDYFENLSENVGVEIKEKFQAEYVSIALKKSGNEYSTEYDGEGEVAYLNYITEDVYNDMSAEKISIENDEVLIIKNNKLVEGKFKIDNNEFTAINAVNFDNAANAFRESELIVFKNKELIKKTFNLGDEYFQYKFAFKTNTQSEAEKANQALLYEFGHHGIFTKQSMLENAQGMFGSFLFIGIFLGTLFLMAAVLIMYYKQISEGYDDKERFGIMEKVGMGQYEIRKAIKSQVLMVFFIPIIFAVIHMTFAFKMIAAILAGFGISNFMILATYTIVSVLIFAVIYFVAYAFTARSYYKIVK